MGMHYDPLIDSVDEKETNNNKRKSLRRDGTF